MDSASERYVKEWVRVTTIQTSVAITEDAHSFISAVLTEALNFRRQEAQAIQLKLNPYRQVELEDVTSFLRDPSISKNAEPDT